MKRTDPLDGFMTPEAFAKAVGVPTSNVRRWICNGELPALKVGRLLVIPENALQLALEDARRPGGR